MATSLNNSGVVFPDNTTQTTAAGAASLVSVANGSLAGVSTVNLSCVSSTYNGYVIAIAGLQVPADTSAQLCFRLITSSGTYSSGYYYQNASNANFLPTGATPYYYTNAPVRGETGGAICFVVLQFPRAVPAGNCSLNFTYCANGNNGPAGSNWGYWNPPDSNVGNFTGFSLFSQDGTTYSAGNYRIYGVKVV